ncbi:BaiN/RdsA family NAD(P)/FAD-dependent oxidoreductase [Alkaliphilus serpentinus]|uniref:NAD(P)/FAD-dependent oxidoreductase n=1 Tax=Alkaliphilus serpentinus TaxID=1482731 RepID=A0A833M8N9_9FIRM|nr:NAD(P)/FAD-dependent oxidoreductase [Alkaliphilus serpentinus]KAB3524951.1 NAD(P)/FAD-dependent oxidoreductase [Alkaliphilus serpentinus]
MAKVRIIVIGGGAAGMMAALTAARQNKEVILIEKNSELGKKLKITGGGRCNITNTASPEEMMKKTLRNGKFLYHSFNVFSSSILMKELEDGGVKLKVEEEGRVLPTSDSSQEIIDYFTKELRKNQVKILFNSSVKELLIDSNRVTGVLLSNDKIIEGNSVIIATGGLSYPSTGSTGDGYRIAKELRHRIVPVKASLVPLKLMEEWVINLMGISFENVRITTSIKNNKKTIVEGGLIFTHFGISGPAVLKLSSYLANIREKTYIPIIIDFMPQVSREALEELLLKGVEGNRNKSIKNTLGHFLPKAFTEKLLSIHQISSDDALNQLTKSNRNKILSSIMEFEATVIGSMGLKEAIVTAGGVDVKEINPKNMESKLVKNLYFAGEVMDVDALTGGYNLHIALSTGYIAGLNS